MTAVAFDSYQVEQAIDDAFAQLVTDIGQADVKVTKSWDDWEQLKGKVVSVLCRVSEPEIVGSGFTGNVTATVEIAMRSHKGDTSGAQHAALEATIGPVFLLVQLATLLSARSTKAAFMTAVPRGFIRSTTGDWRVSTRSVECYVAGLP